MASSGKEGIAKIQKLVPDLIILDMMMPDMTGFEVMKQIKTHQDLSHIPVIICTANTLVQKKNIQEVVSVFYKPIDIDSILTQVNSLIACCNNVTSQSLIINADKKYSSHWENQ